MLVQYRQYGTGTNSTEVHVLTASSGYQLFSLHTGTILHETTGNQFTFLLASNDDIFAIKCVILAK